MVTPRVFLSPEEQRLAALPGNEGEVFQALHEIGAHLVTNEPEPWRQGAFKNAKNQQPREVCK